MNWLRIVMMKRGFSGRKQEQEKAQGCCSQVIEDEGPACWEKTWSGCSFGTVRYWGQLLHGSWRLQLDSLYLCHCNQGLHGMVQYKAKDFFHQAEW